MSTLSARLRVHALTEADPGDGPGVWVTATDHDGGDYHFLVPSNEQPAIGDVYRLELTRSGTPRPDLPVTPEDQAHARAVPNAPDPRRTFHEEDVGDPAYRFREPDPQG